MNLPMDSIFSRQIAISQIPGLTCRERLELEAVLPAGRLTRRLIETVIRRSLAGVSSQDLRRCESAAHRLLHGCTAVHIRESSYPVLLREIYDPPYVLYCSGPPPGYQHLLCAVGSAVPGSRDAAAAKTLAAEASAAGAVLAVAVMPGVSSVIMEEGKGMVVAASSKAGAAPAGVSAVSEGLAGHGPSAGLLDFIRIAPGMARAVCVVGEPDTAAAAAAVEFALQEGREVCLYRPPGRLSGYMKRLAEDGAAVLSSIHELPAPVRQQKQ